MERDRTLTCEQIVDRLDDYLDQGLADAAVVAHLSTCQACAALVADVRAIRATARTLEPIEPPGHVWRHVRARVSLDTPPRTSWLDRLGWHSMGEALGAAAALVVVVGSLAWIGVRLTETPAVQMADASGALTEFRLAEAEYADAIDRLEEAAEAAGPPLDALTDATLQSSIDDIDTAIGDAREALALAPDDALSQESLLDALGSKVALLQDTVALLGNEPATEEQTP
jgi:hypothetical protein